MTGPSIASRVNLLVGPNSCGKTTVQNGLSDIDGAVSLRSGWSTTADIVERMGRERWGPGFPDVVRGLSHDQRRCSGCIEPCYQLRPWCWSTTWTMGLDRASLRAAWTMLVEAARDRGVQVFAVGHGTDCLHAFAHVCRDLGFDDARVIRVRKDDTPTVYDLDELGHAIDGAVDVLG